MYPSRRVGVRFDLKVHALGGVLSNLAPEFNGFLRKKKVIYHTRLFKTIHLIPNA
jgi:hypothetical protein